MIEHIHGARWWKFDFHNHTPASSDFGKDNAAHKLITPEDWLLMYMRAKIDCVAITDHNSGEWIDKLKSALEQLRTSGNPDFREIYLFPGVEITSSTNVHILAIFDTTAGTKEVQALLGAVEFPAEHFGTSDAVSPKSVQEVIAAIHRIGAIAIPAHVDKPSGLLTVLGGHTLTQTLKVPHLLAIELVDPAFVKPELFTQAKVQLAEVVGSDSHKPEQVGTNFTWVKMGSPSLDALRLALHDQEDAVIRKDASTTNPNAITNRYFIKSITVSNGFKVGNGAPLSAEFNPWLSSVIGGRGSGKSTLVNFLRIVFDRMTDMPDEVLSEFERFNRIGSKNSPGMLRQNTVIKVEVCKDGQVYRITWENGIRKLETWDSDSSAWANESVVTNINELFPLQIFNQKELFALTGDPSKLIELIDSQFDKQAWIETKRTLVDKWLVDKATERQLKSAISEEVNLKAELAGLDAKIKVFESSEYKAILEKFNTLKAANRYFTTTADEISSFIEQLKEFKELVPEIDVPENIKSVALNENEDLLDNLSNSLKDARTKLEDSITLLKPYEEGLLEMFKGLSWHSQFKEASTAYQDIVGKIAEFGTESYEELIEKRGRIVGKLNSISEKKTLLDRLTTELNGTYEAIISHEKKLREKRNAVIEDWKTSGGTETPNLIIELLPLSDFRQAEQSLRKLLRKEGNEFSSYIFTLGETSDQNTGIIAQIANEPIATRWEKRLEVLSSFTSVSGSNPNGLDLRLARHIEDLRTSTPEDIDRMMVWVPEDKLVLKFKKDGKEEDIQTGSAGERTAGMLGLLLLLNKNPLVIDQPEDDLDTRLISGFVVPGFKSLKQKRQLLLVTHNPNIAVNANSDNIVYMNFQGGQICVAGNDALQNRDIRLAVCEVMEGGTDALDKRYYRISKALRK